MNCENCGCVHDGAYGSGRFCSSKCSRSFSTKYKRSEINIKVSSSLKKMVQEKKCEKCGSIFKPKNTKIRFCSNICAGSVSKKKGENRKIGSGGLRAKGGRVKEYFEYFSKKGEIMSLNRDELEVAKILDLLELSWKRNWMGFTYKENRKFYPDFYIEDFNKYLEYKGWLTQRMIEKMDLSVKNNKDLDLLVCVGRNRRLNGFGIHIDDLYGYLNKLKSGSSTG